MAGYSTSVSTEDQVPNNRDDLPQYGNLPKISEQSPLPHENEVAEEDKEGDCNGYENLHEEDDEDEDADFNPFLKETNSAEASSSLSSEVEDFDTDIADSSERPSPIFESKENPRDAAKDCHTSGNAKHGEETVMQNSVSSGEVCGKKADITHPTNEKDSVFCAESEKVLLCDKENGSTSQTDVNSATHSRKPMVDMDTEGAICMRTRARYSLASFTLDELETFLQETDDEDDLQNVDDEEEYRKFLAAVLRGDDSQNLQENANVDDEDEENDADFELELEEALESEPEEIEERRMTRRNRRQKASLEHSKKISGQLNRPLRPLLPFTSIGSFSAFDGKHLTQNIAPSYVPPVNNGLTCGFTPHQIGQLHCLIHEHVQLLIQVFSICVLEPVKSHIGAQVKELIVEMLRKRDQVLTWRTVPYPSFCFLPPYVHPSVPDELQKMLPPNDSNKSAEQMSDGRHKHLPDEQARTSQALECTSWVPYICGPVLSVIDVAPLRLVENYIDDVTSALRTYERYQIELGFENHCQKEPLFPLHNSPCSAESDVQGELENTPPDSSAVLSSSSSNQMPKKTMAATLLEKAKSQSVALVPKEIAKLAQRFWPLFNPVLYPHKPPPAPLANRVLFTDAEDELLALGLMEYNTDWKAIQQRFLPCKSRHQIFVRQKNRASSKAPENPIKAVRRMKNSPLTSEEIARIELGDSTDNAVEDNNSGDNHMDKEDEAYVHEAFLADWRPDNNISSSFSSHPPSQEGFQAREQNDSSGSRDVLPQYCSKSSATIRPAHSQVVLRPYRARRPNSARLVKLAPDLPPVNLPPSVRVMSQSAFKSSQAAATAKVPGIASRIGGMVAENRGPHAGTTTKSVVGSSVTSGLSRNNYLNITAPSQHANQSEVLIENCVAERGDSDLQMHPLLFQAPQGGHLPYNPMNFSTSTSSCFTYLPGKQPQLSLSLFHNPRHIRDAVNFLSKSSKTPEKKASSFGVHFHPLLQRADDMETDSVAAHPDVRSPSGALSRKRQTLIQNHCSSSSKTAIDGSSSASDTKGASLSGKVNELDLNIRLTFTSKNQEGVGSRNLTPCSAGRSLSTPVSGIIESESAKDSNKKRNSGPDGVGEEHESGVFALVTSRNKGSNKVSDDMRDESIHEIIMEQEELSDSEEEFGENVEFEREEMADSEGESTSDSEQYVNIPNEEVQLDEMDADIDNCREVNSQDSRVGNTCSTSDGRLVGLELADRRVNIKPNVPSLNLNSCPPISPHSNPKKGVGGYEFGPFGTTGTFIQNQLPVGSKRSSKHIKPGAGHMQKRAKDAPDNTGPSSGDVLPRNSRKRVCRSNSTSSSGVSGKGNPSPNMDTSTEKLNVNTDEFG
ncbi:UNVERIFIED_CONTAM: GON-4-like protein [Sesamum indicum]